MHLIFVLLFVGGLTIKGTRSFSYPPGAMCVSRPPGASCRDDNHCGIGGSCEYVGLSYLKYLTTLLHL